MFRLHNEMSKTNGFTEVVRQSRAPGLYRQRRKMEYLDRLKTKNRAQKGTANATKSNLD